MLKKIKERLLNLSTVDGAVFIGAGSTLLVALLTPSLTALIGWCLIAYGALLVARK